MSPTVGPPADLPALYAQNQLISIILKMQIMSLTIYIMQKTVFAINKTALLLLLLLQEEDAGTLGLSTGQALVKLRDQLSSLLEQHQRTARRRISAQVNIHINNFSLDP